MQAGLSTHCGATEHWTPRPNSGLHRSLTWCQSLWSRDGAAILASLAFYVLSFLVLYPAFGAATASMLAVGPVLVAGWRRGIVFGVACAVISYALTTVLLGFASGESALMVGPGRGAGLPVLIVVGATIGRMRDLHLRLAVELRRRDEAARDRERHDGLLRLSRRLVAESDPSRVLDALLEEASTLVGADAATVFRWSATAERLTRVRSTLVTASELPSEPIMTGIVGRAVREWRPAVMADYTREPDSLPAVVKGGIRAAVAVPLLHDSRLLGVLWIGRAGENAPFERADVELLEVLAAAAGATLAARERARVDGVLLAARTAQHEVNNRLGVVIGNLDLLAADSSLPTAPRRDVDAALAAAESAAEVVRRMGRIVRVEESDWGPGVPSTLDLTRSTPDLP